MRIMRKISRKPITVLLIAALLVFSLAALTGCGKDNTSDLPVVTATPTAEAQGTPSADNPTATPTPNRFPNRADADTGSGMPKDLEAGDVAPEFSLQTLDGNIFRMSEHDNEVVLLNFWATWCGPCVREMPDLMKLAAEDIPGLTIRFISIDDDYSDVDAFVKNNGYGSSKNQICYDAGARVSNYYPTGGIPYTVIVVNGVVHDTVLGSRSYDTYKQLVTDALAGK